MRIILIILLTLGLAEAKSISQIKNLTLLDTMYKSFIYSNDLKNAYKVAKIGAKRAKTREWYLRLSQTAIWLQMFQEGFNALDILYKRYPRDKKIEKKYLEISGLLKNYDASINVLEKKVMRSPKKKDIDDLIYLYNLEGKPIEVAKVLKKVYKRSNDPDLLTKIAQLYYNHADLDLAKEALVERKNSHGLDLHSAKMLSLCYFDKKDIHSSINTLKEYQGEKDSEYWKLLSDYGWFLRDYDSVNRASKKLVDGKDFREVDGHRFLLLNQQNVDKYFDKIWEKYKFNQTLYTYLNILAKNRRYKKIVSVINSIEKKYTKGDPIVYISLANSYVSLKKYKKAKILLAYLILKNPNNSALWLQKIWLSIEMKDFNNIKKDIAKFKKIAINSKINNLALASAYMMIQDIDKAQYYLDKVIKTGSYKMEEKLFMMNILDYQGEYNRRNLIRRDVWNSLNKNPEFNSSKFVVDYLNVAMYYLTPKNFIKLTAKYKKVISKEQYNLLMVSYNTLIDNDDAIYAHYNKIKKPEPWMDMSIALKRGDNTKGQKLLQNKLSVVPYRDAVSMASQNKSIALAFSTAFERLNESRYDYLVDRQFRDLVYKYANYTKAGYDYRVNDTIRTDSFNLHNRYYFGNKLFFTQNVQIKEYREPMNKALFKTLPKEDRSAGFGIKLLGDRDYTSLNIKYRDALKGFWQIKADYNRQITQNSNINLSVGKNLDALQDDILAIGAKEDNIGLIFNHNLLPSLQVSTKVEYVKLYTQDDDEIADGYRFNASVSKIFKSDYPKLQADLYFDYAKYKKRGSGKNGIINSILIEQDSDLTPDDFCAVGVSVRYGDMIIESRKFRPYLALNTSVNCNGTVNYGGKVGVGRRVFRKDYLDMYYVYDKNSKTDETVNNVHIDYKIYY